MACLARIDAPNWQYNLRYRTPPSLRGMHQALHMRAPSAPATSGLSLSSFLSLPPGLKVRRGLSRGGPQGQGSASPANRPNGLSAIPLRIVFRSAVQWLIIVVSQIIYPRRRSLQLRRDDCAGGPVRDKFVPLDILFKMRGQSVGNPTLDPRARIGKRKRTAGMRLSSHAGTSCH